MGWFRLFPPSETIRAAFGEARLFRNEGVEIVKRFEMQKRGCFRQKRSEIVKYMIPQMKAITSSISRRLPPFRQGLLGNQLQ